MGSGSIPFDTFDARMPRMFPGPSLATSVYEELIASLLGFRPTGLHALKCIPCLYGEMKGHPCGSTILGFLPHRDYISMQCVGCPSRDPMTQISEILASKFLVHRTHLGAENLYTMTDGEVQISTGGIRMWFLLHNARMSIRICNGMTGTSPIRSFGPVRIRCACNVASYDRCEPEWFDCGWACPHITQTLIQDSAVPGSTSLDPLLQSCTCLASRKFAKSSWPLGWIIRQTLEGVFDEHIIGSSGNAYPRGPMIRNLTIEGQISTHALVRTIVLPECGTKGFGVYSWICRKLDALNPFHCCRYLHQKIDHQLRLPVPMHTRL